MMSDCFTYIEKSDSTNDRSEGYLYHTCSQSSSLSIYTCIPGASQRCQVKYGPLCGIQTFVLLCSQSFMIYRRSRVGLLILELYIKS